MKILKNLKQLLLPIFILGIMVCSTNSYAQGPNAPEAGAFEPVDATDMVNLVTGDFTYTLPLINVPSPEGGYPLALAYHAGIALDQEASWVGLGWSLNPGAINRGINGYADDWKRAKIYERFYDTGGTNTFRTLSVTADLFTGHSIGLALSHDSDKGFGGSVTYGTWNISGRRASITVGIAPGGKFSIMGSYASGTGYSLSAGSSGIGGSLGTDLISESPLSGSVSAFHSFESGKTDVSYGAQAKGKSFSVGISLDSNFKITGVNASHSKNGDPKTTRGIGISLGNTTSFTKDDYNVRTSSSGFGLSIPTPIGIFKIGYRKRKTRWALNKTTTNVVSGPLYFEEPLGEADIPIGDLCSCLVLIEGSPQTFDHPCPCPAGTIDGGPISQRFTDFMDIYEIGISDSLQLSKNNMTLPAYDNFNVSAQGLSGSMEPKRFKNGSLIGQNREITEGDDMADLTFGTPSDASQIAHTKFTDEVYFSFSNEYSTSLTIDPVNFNPSLIAGSIFDFIDTTNPVQIEARKRSGNFVEYFTNAAIEDGTASQAGLLLPFKSPHIPANVADGIGGYKITTPDGKTYHYALPVYSHEIVTRTFGAIDNKPQAESYFDKQLLTPFATHWLLTAITGPDYIKQSTARNFPDEEDIGYWVRFDYGLWSDAYTYKTPYGEAYDISEENPDIKSYSRGRKQVYYLDKIKTRTHTALFVKSIRKDAQTPQWTSREADLSSFPNPSSYNQIQFSIPSQRSLKLDQVILVKNEDDHTNSSVGTGLIDAGSITIKYRLGKNETATYHTHQNILDITDNISQSSNASIKVIDFSSHYDYSLVSNTPHSSSGRLTLKGLSFLGKGGVSPIPPYKFSYNNTHDFDIAKKDLWGYHIEDPTVWSLQQIQVPLGSKIDIELESDSFEVIEEHETDLVGGYLVGYPYTVSLNESVATFSETQNFQVGNQILVDATLIYVGDSGSYDIQCTKTFLKTATVTAVTNSNISFDFGTTIESDDNCEGVVLNSAYTYAKIYKIQASSDGETRGSGFRVKSVSILDESDVIKNKTIYDYNNPETGEASGVVSYLPLLKSSNKDVPYGSELPAPIPMYEYVTTINLDMVNPDPEDYLSKTTYKFKVLEKKTVTGDNVMYGDLFEISKEQRYSNNFGIAKKVDAFQIKNSFACLGQLLETKSYNAKGHSVSETKNTFKPLDQIDQGLVQDSYQSYKEVKYTTGSKSTLWQINSSTRTMYPSVLESTTITEGGFSNTAYYNTHDVNTGQVIETTSKDSKGNEFKTEIIPAYTIPQYNPSTGYGMGSKVDDISNKNMLTQQAMSKTYIKVGALWKETGIGITTWNNYWTYKNFNGSTNTENAADKKVWRKHKSFAWDGAISADGSYEGFTGDDDNFNWALQNSTTEIVQSNPKWKNTSTITLYDHYSMPLESRNIRNNYTSAKMGDSDSKIVAVSNAAYTEVFYSGAEYIAKDAQGNNTSYFDGHIKSLGQNTLKAHTGTHSVSASTGVKAFEVNLVANPNRKGKYKISVWVEKANHTHARIHINGATKIFNGEEVVAGNWVLKNHYEALSTGPERVYITAVNGTVYFDDFRLHPFTSSMTSYVYNQWDELWYIIGNNGLSQQFEYDTVGRLIKTYTETVDTPTITGGFKRVSENKYNYKRPQ